MNKAADSPSLFRRALSGLGAGLDTLLSPIMPGLALKRLRSRAAFRTALSTYNFARRDRTTADFPARTTSADQAIIPDLATSTPRARQLARDSWMGKSAIGAYLRHVVGTGISCRPVGRDPASDSRRPEGEWKDFNRDLARAWRRWMRSRGHVDLEGKVNLLGVQRWGIREFVTVGESFLVLAYRPNPAGVGLVLQRIEQEQLAAEVSRDAKTGNEIRNGIEVDADGAMMALHVYTGGHRLEYGGKMKIERIPAERVLPLWDLERVRQTHGMSGFHAVGIKAWNVDCYDHNENVAKRAEACISYVRKPGPSGATAWSGLKTPTGQSTHDRDGNAVTEMAPNMIVDAPEGGDISLLNPVRPGAVYDPYMRMQLSQIAAGMETDLAMLLRDYSHTNYSGQQQALLEFWRVTDAIQELVAEQWLRPIWEAFGVLAIAEGWVTPPAGYFTDAAVQAECLEMDWQPPPKYRIDPAKQAAADKLELDQKLTTRTRLLDQRGYTFEETIDDLADEQAYADEKGVDLAPSGVSPFEPRPGSTAGGDNSGSVPDAEQPEPKMRRRPGRNGDRLAAAILAGALAGED